MGRKARGTNGVTKVRLTGSGVGWRTRRFLGSRGHLVGMLFAIGGIVLLSSGVTNGWIGLGLVGLLYATGYFFAERPRATTFGEMAAKDAPHVRAQLDELLATIRMRVADDIYRRSASIADAIVFTLDHAGEHDQADPNIYLVRQTAVTYLPEALSAYLALPRAYAERQLIDGGRTSHAILLEQLLVMDLRVRSIADALIRRNSQELVAHGRFVADRYSPNPLDVRDDFPAAGPPPAANDMPGQGTPRLH